MEQKALMEQGWGSPLPPTNYNSGWYHSSPDSIGYITQHRPSSSGHKILIAL